ncbi:MAG: restriction endonuclease [Alcaligenaceae bacterium]|nr:MAG: restriction endonuclease [Alcaligenaceae bacterium]
MAHSHLRSFRRRAFKQQRGFCYYCCLPMWEDDEAAFTARFGLSARLTRLLRSTAEHVVARCDGGRDARPNIVAACHWCNQRRHYGRPDTAPTADA